MNNTPLSSRRHEFTTLVWVLLIVAAIAWLAAQCIDTEVLGFIKDDGIYAITGKALAQGQGFRLIHVVSEPWQVKYPIGYPLILAAGWLFNPHFPQNLPWLTGLTLAFAMGSLILLFYYLRNGRQIPPSYAFLMMLLVAGNAHFLSLSTVLMSEAPYLFFSLLAIFYAEKNLSQPTLNSLMVCILLSALTFHIRLIGICLIAAITLWLLLQKRWKHATLYTLGTGVLSVLPWVLYIKFFSPHPDAYNFPILNTYNDYWSMVQWLYQGKSYFFWLSLTAQSFIQQIFSLYLPLLPDLPALLPAGGSIVSQLLPAGTFLLIGYLIFQLIKNGNHVLKSKALHSIRISDLYVLISLTVILFWNYAQELGRFLMVLSPWLWLFLLTPLIENGKNRQPAWLQKTLLWLLILVALGPICYIWPSLVVTRKNHLVEVGQYPQLWSDYRQAFAFIHDYLPTRAPIGCTFEAPVYLYTGHPTLHLNLRSIRTVNGKPNADSFTGLMRSIDHYGVGYILLEPQLIAQVVQGPNPVFMQLIRQFPRRFQPVFVSSHRLMAIYRVLPAL